MHSFRAKRGEGAREEEGEEGIIKGDGGSNSREAGEDSKGVGEDNSKVVGEDNNKVVGVDNNKGAGVDSSKEDGEDKVVGEWEFTTNKTNNSGATIYQEMTGFKNRRKETILE